MSSIAKSNISLSKKDLAKSRIPPVASRNVVFYHKATSGQLTINLLSLTMPSVEMPTVSQATVSEISGANLTVNKKNLDLTSSSNGKLIQGLDYIVIDSYNISLIGPYIGIGAEVDEIFVGTINSAPISDLVVVSAKSVDKTYELAVGSTILNLGREYQAGVNPNEDIGSIKVFVNGVLALRDIDYAEVDAGSGYGTTIQFFAAPVSIPYQIAVDFGVMAITDNNAIGAIENLAGSIKKIANDLADVAGTTASDYYSASPSEIERRAFGDMVLDHENRVDTIEAAIPLKADLNGNAANLFSVANAVSSNNATALGQFSNSLTTNGYQKLPNGMIMQWGTTSSITSGGTLAVTFPIVFSNTVLNITVSRKIASTSNSSGFSTEGWSSSGFTIYSNLSIACPVTWFAIGY
jgi:hypothetical protein